MEIKTARLTLLIDPHKKAAFERLCAQRDLTASQVVRQLIRDYLAEHGVSYEPGGQEEAGAGPVDAPVAPAQGRPTKPRGAAKAASRTKGRRQG